MALPNNPNNRKERYLAAIAGQAVEVPAKPITREEAYLDEIAKNGAGGGGTKDYEELTHKPSIGGVVLSGDKSLSDLGAASEEAVAAKASQSDIALTFSDATAYTAGDVVYHDGSLYRFTADHAVGAWDSADVEPVTVDGLVEGLKPVDSITDGDMRPVTSNAVYDAIKIETINVGTVTANSGETANLIIIKAGKVVQLTLDSLTTTGDKHDIVFSGVIPVGYRPVVNVIGYGKYLGYAVMTDAGANILINGSITLYNYSQFSNGTIFATYITA